MAVVGWCMLIFIAFATLGPISTRPHLAMAGVDLERFLAFFCLAGTLGLAYPRQRIWILLLICALAIGLELGQLLEADRHGRPWDALVKVLGVLFGMASAMIVEDMARWMRETRARRATRT